MNQVGATLLAASITGVVSLTVGILAYLFGRIQKEHEVRYSRLYEKRAEVLASLYETLHELTRRFNIWRSFHRRRQIPRRDEQNEPIREILDQFYKVYREQDIWISRDTWTRLDVVYRELDEKWQTAALPTEEQNAKEVERRVEAWVNESLPNLVDGLRIEFQEILGINKSSDASEGRNILQGKIRVITGIVATSLIGLGLGGILSQFIHWWVALLSGLGIGLGVGLLLEFIFPSKKVP
jgi:hypothetical protein